jgi:hypothetical protein
MKGEDLKRENLKGESLEKEGVKELYMYTSFQPNMRNVGIGSQCHLQLH